MNAYATASLYVGDLHPEVTEALLFELFNAVGPVASIRVCRDSVTRRSLGYAYVNFHSVVDAERALETMNYTLIKGKPCRIMWCHRDPSLRKSGSGNVFMKNLDKSIDNKALYDTFSAFGNILSCKVATDENGVSKGYGFVHYETQEAAQQAVQKVNAMLLNGKKVYVGFFVPRKDRGDGGSGEDKFSNIFAKNLPEEVDDEQLLAMFKPFGDVKSAVTMKNAEGKSKGFGFVNFDTHEEALAAVEQMNQKEVNGKTLFVGRAQKKKERERELREKFEAQKMERINKYQGVNLYVKNLDDGISDEKLREAFAEFGTITSARVMSDDKTSSRGFGFVCFATPEEATKAVTEMNGKVVGNKPLYVALAQRKDERRAYLETQHTQRANGARMQGGRPDQGAQAPVYPGAPFFYPPQQMPPQARQQGGFMYPQQMMVPRPGVYQPMPNYPVPMQGARGGRQGGNRNMQGGRMPGNKQQMQQNRNKQMQQQGNYRMNPNARNQRDQMQGPPGGAPMPAQGGPPGQAAPAGGDMSLASTLAAAQPEQQKQILGERLFPHIQQINPELAGKITGMLLEMDNGELLNLLESPESLTAKVMEAIAVLQSVDGEKPAEVAA